MKKLLLWGLVAVLLIIPFMNVKAAANVEITNIELVEATEGVVVNEEPVANGLNIAFNIAFGNVTDHVKYSVTIKNNDEDDYQISNQEASASPYMKYQFVFEDDSDILEAGSEKKMNIIITYENEVPASELVAGKYNETNNVDVTLVNAVTAAAVEIDNPKTSDNLLLYTNLLLASVIICTVAIKTKKVRKGVALVALVLVAIPLGVNALQEITIKLNTEVEISRERVFCIDMEPGASEEMFINENYEAGQTWEYYLENVNTELNLQIVEEYVVSDASVGDIIIADNNSTDLNNPGIARYYNLDEELKTDYSNYMYLYFIPAEYYNCVKLAYATNQEELQKGSSSDGLTEALTACNNTYAPIVTENGSIRGVDQIKSKDKGCYFVAPQYRSTESLPTEEVQPLEPGTGDK